VYKAILFDFFDVIHEDPLRAWLDSFGAKRHGEYDDAANELDEGKITYEEFVTRVAKESGQTPEQVEEMFAKSTINADVKKMIKDLGAHYKIGLISNAAAEELQPILHEHTLHDLFDEIVISSDVKLRKPDPAIFNLMLDKLDIKAEEAIFIDDNQRNIDAANAIGITGIWFEHSHGLQAALEELSIKLG
jgi:2-haloacid dehalogenase